MMVKPTDEIEQALDRVGPWIDWNPDNPDLKLKTEAPESIKRDWEKIQEYGESGFSKMK